MTDSFVDLGGIFVPSDYAPLTEATGDWRNEFDAPYNRTTWGETLGLLGSYQLKEWTWQERVEIIKRARMAWERNPVANTAVSLTTLFVVGKGLNVTYQSAEVKEVLEAFINDPDNDFEAAQTEYLDSLQVDGELFVRVVSERGRTVIVPLEPWNIRYIKHQTGMPLRRIAYNYNATLTNGYDQFDYVDEWIPAEELIHVAINKSPFELRGRSDLFRILPWIKAHKDGLEEISRLIRRMSVYYHLKVQGTPAQVNAARGVYKEPPPPASILVTDKNTELTAVSSNLRASDMSTHVRELRMMNALGKRLPEYMLSDGANANMATTQSQQLPALRNFTYFADVMVDRLWMVLLKRVVKAAVDAGDCPEVVDVVDGDGEAILTANGEPKQIEAVKAFSCGYRELEADDPATLAQGLQLAVTMGWVSNETAAVKLGYDYAVERKKIGIEHANDSANAYANGAQSGGMETDSEPQGQASGAVKTE